MNGSSAAPYLTLMHPSAPQRTHDVREVFNALRYLVRSGVAWRYLPHDFPRWDAVHRQTQRWLRAGCFEAMAHDLRELLRFLHQRNARPTAAIDDSRTVSSSCESGARAGYDGHKKRNGSKIHLAVDTLGHLLALIVTPANAGDRAQVAALSQKVQEATRFCRWDTMYKSLLSIQVTPAPMPLPKRSRKGSCFMWSNSKRPSGALFCCHVAGLWSAVLAGPVVFGDWSKTMKGCPKP